MLLGRHPEGVPAKHRLSPDLFRSKMAAPRFTDVARAAGVGTNSTAGGTVVDDFDGDGRLDIVLTSVDYCAPARLYRNRGDGTFEDRTEAAGLSTQIGGLNASHADYDNDGDLDLFIHRGGWEIAMRNSLLRNDGGRFTDVTQAAGLANGVFATHSAAWADYDNDGWVDVYVGHELAPSRLYRNRGDGTFEDVSARAGVAGNAFTKGVAWGDYDNDGFPDLYASNMFGDNFLYRNRGDGTFEEIAAKLGVQQPFASFPTWWFDYDNDGWLDLFVVAYPNSVEEFVKHYLGQPPAAETLKLYRNDGRGGFTDVSVAAGVARVVPSMGANVGDIDNDGFLDVYLGTGAPSFGSLIPNILLRNDAGRRFDDVTEATGTGHLQKGHGVAFADLDRRRRPGHRAERRRRGAGRPLRRRAVREPGHAGPALARGQADRDAGRTGPGSARRSGSSSRRARRTPARAAGCAIARCRAAARSGRTATPSTSASAAPPPSSRSR